MKKRNGLVVHATLAATITVSAALLSFTTAARASTYDFYGTTGLGGIVSLDITTGASDGSSPGNGGYDITSVTGTVLGDAVKLLGTVAVPPSFNTSPDGEWYYDNILYPASTSPYGTVFDNPGLLVLDTVTNTDVNIFSPGSGAPYILGQSPGQAQQNLYGTLTATPLPSTWTMLIAGFVCLNFFAYRGSKKGIAAIATT